MTYTQFGPWADGSSPGISAEFLNPLETFLLSINSLATDANLSSSAGIATFLGLKVNTAAVSVTGTTAGSASLYQWMQGTIKAFLLYFNGYRNASTTEQTLSLPVAFTTGALWWAGASKSVRPYSGGSALINKVNVITALSNGSSAGTPTASNGTQGYSNGDILAAFDAVGLGINEASNSTGFVLMIGI